MPDWSIYLGAAVAAVYLAICWSLYSSVRKLRRIEEFLQEVDETAHPREFEVARGREAWASHHGFGWLGGFSLEQPVPMFLAVWSRPDATAYFVEYLHSKGRHQEFVTVLSRDEGVTTANTRDAGLFPPRPGSFVEVFDGAELDELLRRHLESVAFVQRRLTPSTEVAPVEFRALMVEAVTRQMDHIRSHALWPLRGPFWFFIRRSRMNGRPVADLYGSRLAQRDESLPRAA